MNGDPILLVDILPEGKNLDDFTEAEKEIYTKPYRREVTRGGLAAYKLPAFTSTPRSLTNLIRFG